MQLIPSIYRANTYSRSDLVFAQARSTRFHYVSNPIICSVYTNNIQRQAGTPGSYRKRRVYSMFYWCLIYTNHVQRGRTPPPEEDDAPPSPSHRKYNQHIWGIY
jgi:hypothetical protein